MSSVADCRFGRAGFRPSDLIEMRALGARLIESERVKGKPASVDVTSCLVSARLERARTRSLPH